MDVGCPHASRWVPVKVPFQGTLVVLTSESPGTEHPFEGVASASSDVSEKLTAPSPLD